MSSKKLVPLSGIAFVVLTVVGFVAISGNTPGLDASPEKVNSFWVDNHNKETIAAIFVLVGSLFLAIFVSSLYQRLRDADAGGVWPTLALVGGGVAVAGFLAAVGIHVALADAADKGLDPGTLRTLNVIDNDDFFGFAPPLGAMLLGAAGSSLGAGALPKWMGWTGLVLGILSFTPVGFFAFGLAGLWIIAASVIISREAKA